MNIQHLNASQADTTIEGFRDFMYSEKLCEKWDQETIDTFAESLMDIVRGGIASPISFPKVEPNWPGTTIPVGYLCGEPVGSKK